MTLNPLQQQAFYGLVEYADKREHKFALLLGPAGSGKTFTLASVIQEIKRKEPNRPLLVVAPTHKAVAVARKALAKYDIETPYSTVSSLIGKAPSTTDDPDDEGKAQWRRGEGGGLERGALVILDEVSMVPLDEMKSVQKAINIAEAQLICVGDFSQLKPVKGQSLVDVAEKIPVRFKLNEVMRSDSGNIVAMSKAVRTTGQLDLDAVDNKTVFIYNDSDAFERAFTTAEGGVAIAYTNRRVSQLNQMKRRHIYGDNPAAFMPQEKVILTESPYFIRRRSNTRGTWESIRVADNNSELVVEELGALVEETSPFASKHKIPFYNATLTNPETKLTFEAEVMTYDMYVSNLEPAMMEVLANLRTFSTKLARLDDKCRARDGVDGKEKFYLTDSQITRYFTTQEANWIFQSAKTNPKFISQSMNFQNAEDYYFPTKGVWNSLRGLLWPSRYFGLRSRFAVLVYEHAFTAHRSQGSSFTKTFVDWPNLETIRDGEDRQAACYVAVSRASETLHIRI
jgi:hypothetical protein